MHYTGTIYRPPAEAKTLLLQVTVGCSHDRCTFCSMYKDVPFRIEPIEQIEEDLREFRSERPDAKRVYLVGGDPFVLSFERLKIIAEKIKEYLPLCETISMYARVTNIKTKSTEELKALRSLGINHLYIGIETGHDETLTQIHKGNTAEEAVVQCKRLEEVGITYHGIYLNGLAGHSKGEISALETAEFFNQLKPKSIGITSLTLIPGTNLYEQKLKGEFVEATEFERVKELKCFIEHLDTNTKVFANHVSMATPVVGKIPEDRPKMLKVLQDTIDDFDEDELRQYREQLRQL
ncbi:radical SAM protein [Desulfosporosinus nitroreducens]|uniref:Radical SAM protein n=1 Tax=Desulfosporosinus nitroreducens TaxID=2018668 RepID=A0ABT8QR37_9FIRM|nr:radical SAM protein [Desulfosporosinus nitroreducens]MDO0823811.1 radical SAM protein [Desulfosporosinus nitroreducens]